jgi:hypothetical protein
MLGHAQPILAAGLASQFNSGPMVRGPTLRPNLPAAGFSGALKKKI